MHIQQKMKTGTKRPMGYETSLRDYETLRYENFLILVPLTLCPIDTEAIELSMLSDREVEWLNWYHKKVCDELLPHLTDPADQQWLREATKEIQR